MSGFICSLNSCQSTTMLKINPRLRRTLAKIYNKVRKIMSLSDDAGVDHGEIGWKDSAYNVWYQVLYQCMKDPSKLSSLLAMVREENPPMNEYLKEVEKMFAGGSSELIEALKKIKLDNLSDMGSLDRFNCGRVDQSNEFWNPKDIDTSKTLLLTGLVQGDASDRPESLARRLVYEYLQIMEAEEKVVLYKRDAQKYDIKEVSINAKTDKSLEWVIDQYLEEFKGQGALDKYGAIAHILSVNVAESFNVVEKFTKLAIDKFSTFAEKHKAHNLLMLVFDANAVEDSSSLRSQLSSIAKNDANVKYFDKLGTVSSHEMKDWFVQLGAQNTEAITPYIDRFIVDELQGAVANPFSSSKGTWPMEKMLLVQDQIFQYAMKKDGTNVGPEDV